MTVCGGKENEGEAPFTNPASGMRGHCTGQRNSLALKDDGSIAALGANNHMESTVPHWATKIASGSWHSLALLENGTVVAWGNNDHGQCTISPFVNGALRTVDIAAGKDHSRAILDLNGGKVAGWGRTHITSGMCRRTWIMPGQLMEEPITVLPSRMTARSSHGA